MDQINESPSLLSNTIEVKHLQGLDLIKRTPENPISRFPLLIAPGWGGNADSYKMLFDQLYSQGFSVLLPEYKYGHEPKKWLVFPDVNRAKQEGLLAAIDAEEFSN